MKYIIIITILGILGGCGSAPRIIDESEIYIYDPEQDQYNKMREADLPENSPPEITVGSKNNISIEVNKGTPFYDDEIRRYRDRWIVAALNLNDTGKCITPRWKLMDFNYITNQPSEFYIGPKRMIIVGEMVQNIWVLDGVPISLPASGYLDNMLVRNPNTSGEEKCGFIVPEEDIIHGDDIDGE